MINLDINLQNKKVIGY